MYHVRIITNEFSQVLDFRRLKKVEKSIAFYFRRYPNARIDILYKPITNARVSSTLNLSKEKQIIYCGKCGTSLQFHKTSWNPFTPLDDLVTFYSESCLECNSTLTFRIIKGCIQVQTIFLINIIEP